MYSFNSVLVQPHLSFCCGDGRTLGQFRLLTGSLGEELKLTIRGMLETAVGDCFEEFWLEQEISETGRIHSNVATLFIGCRGSGQTIGFGSAISCSSIPSSGISSLELLVGIIDEIFFVRHFDELRSGMSLNCLEVRGGKVVGKVRRSESGLQGRSVDGGFGDRVLNLCGSKLKDKDKMAERVNTLCWA